jgi:hypothetical protein
MSWPPQSGFFRVPNAACDDWLPVIGPSAWAVYSVLARMADQNGECYPSLGYLTERAGLKDQRTARRGIEMLVTHNLVTVSERWTERGARRSNVFRLNSSPPAREGTLNAGGANDVGVQTMHESAHPMRAGAQKMRVHRGTFDVPHNKNTLEADPQEEDNAPAAQAGDSNGSEKPFSLKETPAGKSKSKKRNGKPRAKREATSDDIATAEYIWQLIHAMNPNHKVPDINAWANDVRLMRGDGPDRTHEGIRELFAWVNRHDFWQSNILSPGKLRKQWDTMVIKKQKANGNGQAGTAGTSQSGGLRGAVGNNHNAGPNPYATVGVENVEA